MMRRTIYIMLLLSALCLDAKSQSLPLDSIKDLALNNVYADPEFADSMCELYINRANPDRDIVGLAQIYKYKGAMAFARYDLKSALQNFFIQRAYANKSGQPLEILSSLNNIGLIYIELESFDKALDNLYQAEKFEGNDEYNDMQSGIQTNIGLAHSRMGNDSLALVHYFKAYDLCDTAISPDGMALILNNIGSEYLDRKDSEKAKPFLDECISIATKYNDRYALIMAHTNMSTIYVRQDSTTQAIRSLNEVKRLASETGGESDGANANFLLGKIYFQNLEQKQRGLNLMEESLVIIEQVGNYDKARDWTKTLGEFYDEISDHKSAAVHFQRHIKLKDSLVDVETARLYAEMDIVNEVEKTKSDLRALSESHEELQEESATHKLMNRFLVGAAIAIAVILLLVFYNYRQKQKANVLLEDKNQIIQQKNKEVHASIVYAERIQSAILPSDTYFKERFPNSFIMYQPKDIVSGDFYWMTKIGDVTFFAVGDCTGHGVPGSLVSVICSNALERVIQVIGETDPGKILDAVNNIVIEKFSTGQEEVKDGMDVALCVIDGNKVRYAGANNPLWYFNKEELSEIAADKQPIGQFTHTLDFTTKEFDVTAGDRIYMFSDGFADQFGGEKTKKMTIRRFQEVVKNSTNLGIIEQGDAIQKYWYQWKGEVDQIDDVCLVGIQF